VSTIEGAHAVGMGIALATELDAFIGTTRIMCHGASCRRDTGDR